jgi:hypothetical protein
VKLGSAEGVTEISSAQFARVPAASMMIPDFPTAISKTFASMPVSSVRF